jgi:uncharacterized membrane protein
MKFLIALFSVLALNVAQAEMGRIESFFSPSLDEDHDKVVHLYLQNNCNQEIYVATRGQNPNQVWESKGHYRIYPGQVVPAGDMINDIYYLNAFSGDRRVRWEGPHHFEIHGKTVRAALVELPKDYGGNWTTVLYCY